MVMTEAEIAERAVEAYKWNQLVGYSILAAIIWACIYIRAWWHWWRT